MKTLFKFTFFVLFGISALGFVATAFLYVFNPDKAELVEEPEQVASVSDTTNEVSAPIETSDPEGKQPPPTAAMTAPAAEAAPEQIPVDTTSGKC